LHQATPPLIRPPSEADALILQATYGCSRNRCAFCVTYRERPFKVRPLKAIEKEVESLAPIYQGVRKVFLGDGDPMVLPAHRLLPILGLITRKLPSVRRIAAYAAPGNFSSKSLEDLTRLREAGLTQVYMGFESGDDEVLRRIDKGATKNEILAASDKLQAAGIKLSAIIILGLGGPALSMRHAENSARLVNRSTPRFLSALTLMLAPRAPTYEAVFDHPEWRELTPREILVECRRFIECIDANGIIFRANHVSNYLALSGTLQKSKERLLREIDCALEQSQHGRLGFGM
jgi:radical SAM superfamily enzyme YgiQ (UPF0313 family)